MQEETSPFHDRYVLITGASSGIGRATAELLADCGARVLLVARRAIEMERICAGIQSRGGQAWALPCDIESAQDLDRLPRSVSAITDRLHFLINNAGITAHGRFDRTAPRVLRKTMELNFFAMTEVTRLLLPALKQGAPASIVLVSTPSGLYGVPGRFAYSASKAAGHAFMQTLGMELRQDDIHTLIFCPGYVKTALRQSGLTEGGDILNEEQDAGAIEPEEAARRLMEAIIKKKRIAFTGFNGRAVYWLRALAPAFLEKKMMHKLKKDFI
jgi:short-subunit dehydrogenase